MIDRATIERIKEAANIVDVVSEFVTLRKSGANYKGLCPFHDEKTPSFFVSPSRGMCHCFGCGKGGNPISFIMEHEQASYPEALRWLARKYNIEIKEREISDEEKKEQTDRESMFVINEWAATYFETILKNNVDGVALGMAYLRNRGFRDDIIKKFRLGFDLNNRESLAYNATKEGYKTDFLLKTGLCYKRDDNRIIDRFAGRIIFPWIGISGKIVGFGGRLLDARTKGVQQKYVNSPDSNIYHKDHELYGIYQAKKSISKEDCVYMVEGYTDVISLHQCGIENVVANSGTALSIHQINTLHRFTSNIVLIYDGDQAGIHAALRGTDMILSEGMNLKVLLLPNGEDPDSFAQKNSAKDIKEYIEQNKTDFIQFKTKLMIDGVTDPVKRSQAITSIVKSIALVQNQILRDTYIKECSQKLNINEATLINTMNAYIKQNIEEKANYNKKDNTQEEKTYTNTHNTETLQDNNPEAMLIQMVVKYGDVIIFDNVEDEMGNYISFTVAQYINYNLSADNLQLHNTIYKRMLQEAVEICNKKNLKAEQFFLHHEDLNISNIAAQMVMQDYRTPKNKIKEIIEDEETIKKNKKEKVERIKQQTLHIILDFRMKFIETKIKEIKTKINNANNTEQQQKELFNQYNQMYTIRNAIAKELGNNILL